MIDRKKPPPKNKLTPADKAFTAPEKSTLDDLKLEPWTPERIIRANELGFLWPNIGKDGFAQFRRTKLYPGAVRDTILFVFLSQLPPEEVEDATWKDAKAFGVKRSLHNADTTAFWHAYVKMIEVHDQQAASMAVPKGAETAGEEEEDETDPKD